MSDLTPFGLADTHGILNRHLAARSASSDGFGWSSIYASAQTERPFSQTFSPVPDLLLVMHRDKPVRISGHCGQQRFAQQVPAGGIHVIPGCSEFSINLSDELDTLHVYIRAFVIEQVARQMSPDAPEDICIRPMLIGSDRVLQAMLETVSEALENDCARVSVNIDYVAQAIAAHLVQNYSNYCPEARRAGSAQPQGLPPNLARAIRFMEQNIDCSIRLEDIAEVVSWSASHLAREFRTRIGMPPHKYLLQLRVEKARSLLETSDLPIAEIAFECGFAHQEHLTRHFRRLCQSTPAAHRRDHLSKGKYRPSASSGYSQALS